MREIELKSSPLMGLLLAGMLLLALLAIHLAALPGGVQLVLGLAATGWCGWSWWRTSPRVRLCLTAEGQLQSRDAADEWHEIEVLGDSFVSTRLIVLRYRVAGQPVRSLTLLPDSADAEDLRRLRVSLRWTRRTRSDTSCPDAG